MKHETSKGEKVLELLEVFRKRPAMYVYPVSVETVDSFLYGLSVGLNIGDGESAERFRRKAQVRRGWKWRNTSPIPQMREKGLDDVTIIAELIAIERDALLLADPQLKKGATPSPRQLPLKSPN